MKNDDLNDFERITSDEQELDQELLCYHKWTITEIDIVRSIV